MVVAIVLAILAPLISRFIQLAVSRQREYLADASAVELTRNPYGLERALAKIGPTRRSSRSPTGAPSTCTSPTRSRSSRQRSSGLMSTHPADPRPDQPAARADGRAAARGSEPAALAGLE